jgi:hypothetical protein
MLLDGLEELVLQRAILGISDMGVSIVSDTEGATWVCCCEYTGQVVPAPITRRSDPFEAMPLGNSDQSAPPLICP